MLGERSIIGRQKNLILELEVPLEMVELTLPPGRDLAGVWLCMIENGATLGLVEGCLEGSDIEWP